MRSRAQCRLVGVVYRLLRVELKGWGRGTHTGTHSDRGGTHTGTHPWPGNFKRIWYWNFGGILNRKGPRINNNRRFLGET